MARFAGIGTEGEAGRCAGGTVHGLFGVPVAGDGVGALTGRGALAGT